MINKELLKEIVDYCELNDLQISKILNEALRGGFTIVKYGPTPLSAGNQVKTVEVIKEVIKEVPVEKIVEVIKFVEVEKIVEVPVDKEVSIEKIVEVIKEVPVEKNINITVDGNKISYMEYIDQLNINIGELEVNKKKLSKELLDTNNKNLGLEKDLSDYKTRLKSCMDEKKSGLDLYGE